MKNTQIIMLVLVFVVCGVCGYFLEGAVIGDREKEADTVAEAVADTVAVAEPEAVLPARSTVPVIEGVVKSLTGTKYTLTVKASVESEDPLSYLLYADKDLKEPLREESVGKFVGIRGNASGIYYVVVKNMATEEFSAPEKVEKIFMQVVNRITEEELNKVVNALGIIDKNKDRVSDKLEIESNMDHIRPFENMAALKEHIDLVNCKAKCSKLVYDDDGKLCKFYVEIIEQQ